MTLERRDFAAIEIVEPSSTPSPCGHAERYSNQYDPHWDANLLAALLAVNGTDRPSPYLRGQS